MGNGTRSYCVNAIQWQELERQRMIYKCMMSSTPVPSQLLSSSDHQSNMSRNSDPEPWRCRRTDGKKWRCSRDAAPDLKYCERHTHKNSHAHKNRTRSRKPVESQTHNSNSCSLSNKTDSPVQPVFQFPEMVSSSCSSSSVAAAASAFGHAQERYISDSSFDAQQWDQFWSCSSEKDENGFSVSSSSSSIDKQSSLSPPLSLWMSGSQPPGGPLGEALGPNMAKISAESSINNGCYSSFSSCTTSYSKSSCEDAIGFRF